MAKRSPAELKQEAEEVSKIIAQGKKKTLNFALMVAPEGVVLQAHLTKGPDAMARAAKALGAGPKGCRGTLDVEGKRLLLTCEDDSAPKTLPKLAKRHFTSLGLTLKVILRLPNGEELTDEDEDEAALTADSQEGVAGAQDDGIEDAFDPKGELLARLKACVGPVKAFNASNEKVGSQLITALKAAQKALGSDDLERAEQLVASIERTLGIGSPDAIPVAPKPPEQPKPKPPSDEDLDAIRQKLRQAFRDLAAPLKLFLQRGEPSLAGKARQLATAFGTDIEGSDMKRAARVVSTLKSFLDAHTPNLPIVTEAERAATAVAAAQGVAPAGRYEKAAGIQAKYRQGSVAAKAAFDGFAAVLGDQEATPELLARSKAEVAVVKEEMQAAQKRLDRANTLPDGPEKDAAIQSVSKDIAAVQTRLDAVNEFDKTAQTKAALTKALTVGPLSASSGQTLPDDTAAALITAFTRDLDFATTALEMAGTAIHPEGFAKGLPALLDLKDTGFAFGDIAMDAQKADAYAKDLLKMGGNVGPAFFDRMPDYMGKGYQFKPDPLHERGKTGARLAQRRTVKLAQVMVGADGTIQAGSNRLAERTNHMLFSPDCLKNPTPALSTHVLKTIQMFSDPVIAQRGNAILADLPDTPSASAKPIVKRALRKSSSLVLTKTDMQISIMASMMKSLDQGPVGSCFATGPARLMREQDPMAAMDAYAQVASKGTFTPKNGVEVPVVTRIHSGEDPILRGFEYAVATTAAMAEKSSERRILGDVVTYAVNGLGDKITDVLIKKADDKDGFFKSKAMKSKATRNSKGRKKNLTKEITDAFDFTYDALSAIGGGVAQDGHSSAGRYVLVSKETGTEIRSEADFVDEVTRIALDVYGLDPASPYAALVKAEVSAPAFLTQVQAGDYKPWLLPSGGYSLMPSKCLFGEDQKQEVSTPKGRGTEAESERTKEVLANLLDGFVDSKSGMQNIEVIGSHVFNGLPQDPSLAPLLKGGKAKLAENIQKELLDKGAAIAATSLPADRAQYLYDKMIARFRLDLKVDAHLAKLENDAATHRPTVDMTPAALDAAFENATLGALDDLSSGYPDAAAARKYFDAKKNGAAKTIVLTDLGAPQFTIADTNWGDAESHTYFVIAPDPATGEPIMWKKTIPPGSLSPAGREWVDRRWDTVQ